MFGFKSKEKMNFIQNYRPTSKAQLLQVALWYHNGDTKKAQEMVDYYTNNIQLPDFDPIPQTWQQNTAQTVNSVLGWIKENQDTLVQGYQFIQGVIANKGAVPTIVPTEAALPPINE